MARPKYAGKVRSTRPANAPLEGVLVPRNKDLPIVTEAIERNPELKAYAEITARHILQTWGALATADITDAVRVVVRSCRYCHGINHWYQWANEDEWAGKAAEALDKGKEPPSNEGGFGFDPRKDPDGACPACFGRGLSDVEVLDYRDWPPEVRLLYNGAKMGRNGVELQWRDRDKLLEMAAKHLGMFKEQIEHTGAGGVPLFTLSPAEAAL